jgi:membrane protease YdiL (CAAX protease family)
MALWAPLGVLVLLAALASVLSFGFLQLAGDVLPLAKLVSKVTLGLLLISVFPFRKILKLSWQDIGFSRPKPFFLQIGLGLLLGLLTLSPVLVVLYTLDVHVWDQSRTWTWAKILQKTGIGLCLAMLIGIGEELLFRGLLLGYLRRQLPLILAIGISAFFYAALHFLKSKTLIPFYQQNLGSGFELMAEAFANWLNPEIVTAFSGLFVVGVFLALLRSRLPNSLGFCIGCHAGWVWLIKVSKDFCNVNPHSEYLYLVSSYDGVVGPLVSVWLTAAMLGWLIVSNNLQNTA